MGAERHPFPPFAWKTLGRGLSPAERTSIDRAVRGFLRFQRALAGWRAARAAPDATPFVSLYAAGRLCGCYGSVEGAPADRLARAFLRAAHDDRFGGIRPEDRDVLAAQVSYPVRARLLNPEVAAEAIEIGTDGVAFVRDRTPHAILLPHVARDQRLGPREMLVALARKAGKSGISDDAVEEGIWSDGALYAFETEDVVVRDGADPRSAGGAEAAAAAWLAGLVDADGSVTFAIDPRARRRIVIGEMHHARAAVVVDALAAHGRHAKTVARARTKLDAEARAALAGKRIAGWPRDPAAIAGTLALAVRAGVPLVDELVAFARTPGANATPWHAGQIAAALGNDAPRAAWDACVADLVRRPFAPWTAIAARVRGDRAVFARAARGVAEALRTTAPHRGGAVAVTLAGADAAVATPETALTAIAIEALAGHDARWAAAAVARAVPFVARMQLVDERLYAALDPAVARGAFAASPTVDLLRGDVTGHALLALRAVRVARSA